MLYTPGPHLSYIKPGEITNIVKVRLLSELELKSIEDARDKLVAFANHSALWSVVQLNAQDFRQYLTYAAEQHKLHGGMDERSLLIIALNANRLVLNILTALRTFRDHSRTNAYRRYGRHSAFVASWQAMISKHEAAFFSYRFLYELRNYVQHCGMPLGQIQFNSEQNPAANSVDYSARFNFSRDDLLANYNAWSPDVKNTLSTLEERFPVLAYIDEVMEPIGRMALGTMELELPMVRPALATFDGLTEEINDKEASATPCIVEFGCDTSKLQITYLPLAAVAFGQQFTSDFDAGKVPSSL